MLTAGVVALVAVVAALRADRAGNAGNGHTGNPVQPSAVAGARAVTGEGARRGFPLLVYQGEEALGGEEIDFTTLLGRGRPVVLNFWAGGCPACWSEMPSLQQVYDEYGGAFLLVGVDVGPFVGLGSHDDGRFMLGKLQVTYPAGAARSSPVQQYGIRSMPTTIFFNGDGTVFATHTGFITERQLRDKVEALLAASR